MLSRVSVWNSSLNSWTQDCSVWNGPPNTVRHKITLFETVHWIQTQNYSVWNGQLNTIRHQMTVSKTVNWIQSDTRLLCLKQTTEYNRTQDYSETVHWTQSDARLLSAKLVEVNLQREQWLPGDPRFHPPSQPCRADSHLSPSNRTLRSESAHGKVLITYSICSVWL